MLKVFAVLTLFLFILLAMLSNKWASKESFFSLKSKDPRETPTRRNLFYFFFSPFPQQSAEL